jgi:hypothetical protein
MSFFSFFKKNQLSQDVTDFSSSAPFPQKRRHQRYPLSQSDLCTLNFEMTDGSLHSVQLLNISHFGCLVDPGACVFFDQLKLPSKANLSLAGRSQSTEIIGIDRRKEGIGLTFSYSSVEALQAMADLILPLHWGSTATFLGEEPSVKDSSARRLKFRGEGQFDLRIECRNNDDVRFIMGTFLLTGSHYVSVIWDGTHLSTKKSLSGTDTSARMSKTDVLDERAVLMCAAACLAVRLPVTKAAANVLVHLVNQ